MTSETIPYRVMAVPYLWHPDSDTFHILMVTSRTRRRWIFPKGKHDKGVDLAKMLEIECYEEAGIRGTAHENNGIRRTYKDLDGYVDMHVRLFEVTKILQDWPEAHQRKRSLYIPQQAISLLEKGLRTIVEEVLLDGFGTLQPILHSDN